MELVAEATSPGVTGEQSTSGHEVAAGGDAGLACVAVQSGSGCRKGPVT